MNRRDFVRDAMIVPGVATVLFGSSAGTGISAGQSLATAPAGAVQLAEWNALWIGIACRGLSRHRDFGQADVCGVPSAAPAAPSLSAGPRARERRTGLRLDDDTRRAIGLGHPPAPGRLCGVPRRSSWAGPRAVQCGASRPVRTGAHLRTDPACARRGRGNTGHVARKRAPAYPVARRWNPRAG